jgi:RNA polymerase sigma factor (TIGR02999 family)
MQAETDKVTELLVAWAGGDAVALEQLMPMVYRELRRLANRHLVHERPNHTLDSGALVNEAYLKLVDQRSVSWQNRAHFFAIAARLMRRILVDHARARAMAKRGGGNIAVSLQESAIALGDRAAELVEIDEALNRLAQLHPRKSEVVELRFFTGLSIEETAAVLKVSPNTVMRDWLTAKAWLHRELANDPAKLP